MKLRFGHLVLMAFSAAAFAASGCGSSGDSGEKGGGSTTTGGSDSGGNAGAGADTGNGGTGTGADSGSGASNSTGGTAGSGSGGNSGSGGSFNTDCKARGDSCDTASDCCSEVCDPTTDTCATNLGTCSDPGAPCGDATECCTHNCQDGKCQADACTGDGDSCTDDAECCSGTCDGNQCKDINGFNSECKSAGNACDDDLDCCSKLCGENGTCSQESSYCAQLFDVCSDDSQCCQGICNKADGDTFGYCAPQETGGTRCGSKLLAGEVCLGNCSECCSRSCAPFGPSGVSICQPAGGCRPEGELCNSDLDCCGGDPDSGLPGAGNAKCEGIEQYGIGRCSKVSCNPQGNICKIIDDPETPGDEVVLYEELCGANANSPANCCEASGVARPCQFDRLNIPRCNTLTMCRMEGETCSSSTDCCNSLPCVQNEEGKFICYNPPDGDCVASGGPCTNDGDCCVGSSCILQPGDATGVCGATDDPPPPDGTGGMGGSTGSGGSSGSGGSGGTGGTGGSMSCASYGQSCSMDSDCCSADVPCDGGICRFAIGG